VKGYAFRYPFRLGREDHSARGVSNLQKALSLGEVIFEGRKTLLSKPEGVRGVRGLGVYFGFEG